MKTRSRPWAVTVPTSPGGELVAISYDPDDGSAYVEIPMGGRRYRCAVDRVALASIARVLAGWSL